MSEDRDSVRKDGIVGGSKGEHYRFTVLGDGLLRMEWAPDCVFEDRRSAFAATRDQAKIPPFEVRETHGQLEIITKRFHLTYDKQQFSAHGLYALVFGFTRSLWRFKEEGQPNLGGTYRTLDNVDGQRDIHTDRNIEIEPGVLSPKGYALLDDSKSMLFDDQKGFIDARRPGNDRIDCYLFAYGHDYRQAVKALYSISGPTPVLPRWALGNWWSRYYEYTSDSYIALMDKFKEEGIPLSVAVIDMDWHLVDDKRVKDAGQTGWTGYTWNRDLFPDPPAFMAELHKRKLQITLNDHPADGIHSYEDIYTKVAEALHHDTSKNEPIPFDCVDPAYLRAYFDIVLKSIDDDGCDFWWIDWQQGPFSRLKDVDPLWVLNHYHFLHNSKKEDVKNPIIFSRFGGPGSHRYPVGFSGDTVTTWASLDFQPEFTAMASNIGYGWWSHDIGGHMLGVRDDELTVRWVQFGVLSPIMRLHSTKNKWVTKEPWRLPPSPGSIVTSFLRLRHRLIPYLQTMNVRAANEGEPLVQPMYWEYPDKDEAYRHKNQYLFGTEMLVIPITTPQDPRVRVAKVKGWLPPGTYVDYFSGVVYEGDRELWISRSLDQYPVFLRKGSIVPLDAASTPENGGANPNSFEIILVVGADGAFEILEDREDTDDNERHRTSASLSQTNWDRTPLKYVQETGALHIGPIQSGNPINKTCQLRSWTVRLLGAAPLKVVSASQDGAPLNPYVTIEDNGLVVQLGETTMHSTVALELGPDPQLRRNEPLELIEPVLQHAQIEYDVKDKLWETLTDERVPMTVRVSRLQTLEMNPNLRLFLTEYLLADSTS
ncbi:putative alpha-xylosidase [Mariannaea sp. PMI_226]|nr:putative alpha-xylosidase [Mariannaea sp. PMI_226]